MFKKLSNKLLHIINNIKNKKTIKKNNINKYLKQIKYSFLKIEVLLPTVNKLIKKIKKKTIKKIINYKKISTNDFINIIKSEMKKILGHKKNYLNLSKNKLSKILIIGSSGSGKTTSIAKIGKYLSTNKKKKVLVISIDLYRPAALKQLQLLIENHNIDFFYTKKKPTKIIKLALKLCKKKLYQIILIDTPGIYFQKKNKINKIYNIIKPNETLLSIDVINGQNLLNETKKLYKNIITGVILTKMDSDIKGGIIFSILDILKQPIKFIGTGENIYSLEKFQPQKIIQNILKTKKISSNIKKITKIVDYSIKPNIIQKIKEKQKINFLDFLSQIKQINKFGGINNFIKNIPGISQIPNNIISKINNNTTKQIEAIINSMTYEEKINPDIINHSRKIRISHGCGVNINTINKFLQQFKIIRNFTQKNYQYNIQNIINNIKDFIF